MILCNNDITIYRGEQFTIDYNIVFPDGSPFIVSNEMSNPYFLISLSTHKGENQEVFNYWLPVSKKFQYTKPLDIQDFKISSTSTIGIYEKFDDITLPMGNFYLNGQYVTAVQESAAVYSNSKEPGVYKYISGKSLEDYTCSIIHAFNTNDTKQWKSEKYYYTIQLVDGQDMRSYLLTIAMEHHIERQDELSNMTNEELYNLLLNDNVIGIDKLDITQPIVKIDASLPIMSPAIINVTQYMQGGVL